MEGNIQAEKKIQLTKKLLDLAGVGADRLHLAWVSSAEAQRFVQVAGEVIETVKEKGPLDKEALSMRLDAAEMTVNGETIRWLVGKEVKITTDGDVYGRKWDVASYESVMHKELEREYQKNLIYLAIKDGATSVRAISKKIGVQLLRTSYLLADLERTNMVEFTGMDNSIPVFAAI
ncbi:MAG: hydrogenase iron-sulfur subunit [Desulfobacterales bacterium]|nr:hydrogenase iron-sulfur subunit [Desulfobacterales bacterium]